ncbi:hypothetical protein A1O3_07942 [Capronia epimyces CBS 606.96]|uniref:polynucleotide adenylyltransferase n=1 Tax=Capronia epimyces CBS 606.96 TaxID=1182542 RepID=W9XGL6_9EURO|nr:uncharacterized protein A1O3_07942 [Capronia epimyces CBS 606.96]EXJ79662.1 hypothetical protein A1O3_07942 [Capronia epimyces CBS 606.96]
MTYKAPKDGGKSEPTPMTVSYTTATLSEMEGRSPVKAPSSSERRPGQLPPFSNSGPSTPFQRPQSCSEKRTSPSPEPVGKSVSPLSLPSDKSQTPPAGRKQYGGCKYETGMARARRRVPYSLGPEPLEKVKTELKTRLTHEENEKLTADMQTLYEALQPTAESEKRRSRFIEKLDKILRGRWPTSSINVNVFGSTGNNLGTSDSDVDVCITTDCKEMERVCSIADLLAKHGMERVVCVSSAKVPIVKIWDPELQVACDINVNNPLALENTELVRAYVGIDSRVRPLAMIIKYWAKRRILNDAALGGTLSSYTWICLALNFLQTRDPPILPALQQQPKLEPKFLAGVNVAFDRDVQSHKDFGSRNKSSLGELLFHFFRYYSHEFDLEQSVVSVRLGRVLPKVEKSWHLLQDNRLCVEEPFNISRNLANTADDTSMRGIHLELRRAYKLIGEGKLEDCCEQFEYPAEEIKPSEHFVPPSARPVIPQLPTQAPTQASTTLPRPGRNPARGGRHASHVNRNSSGRRSSNPSGRSSTYLRNLPFQMTTQELQLQAQHQQHLLHDQLFQQYQYLQLQEQELRMQLHQQNLRQRGLMASAYHQHPGYAHYASHEDGLDFSTNGQMSRAPMSAPLYQQRFAPSSPYLASSHPSQGVATNPSSPRLNSAIPDSRRYSRRTSVTQSSGAALRAQSTPARAVPVSSLGQMHSRPDRSDLQDASLGRRSSASSTSQDHFPGYLENGLGISGAIYDPMRRPAEYLGYYVGQSPSLSAYTQSTTISPIPSHVGLAIQHGGLSPRLIPASTRTSGTTQTSLLQTVPTHASENQEVEEAVGKNSEGVNGEMVLPNARSGPLIVDGSVKSPRRQRTTQSFNEPDEHVNFSASTSEDLAFDTPSSSDEQSQADTLDSHTRERSPSGSLNTAHKQITQSVGASEYMIGHLPLRTLGSKPKESHTKGTILADSVAMNTPGVATKGGNAAWPLDRQLSSVEEVRTPSPRVEGFNRECLSPKFAGSTSQDQSLGEAEGTANGDAAGPGPRPLAARPNGSVGSSEPTTNSTAGVSSANDWQTQKKRRKNKKTVKSENDAHLLNISGGESLPADESLRKGG